MNFPEGWLHNLRPLTQASLNAEASILEYHTPTPWMTHSWPGNDLPLVYHDVMWERGWRNICQR